MSVLAGEILTVLGPTGAGKTTLFRALVGERSPTRGKVMLQGRDVPIVEHLRGLRDVPERGGRFFAVPAKVQAFGSFPVRAFVLV